MTDLEMDLDTLGEQAGLYKLYTQIAFIFSRTGSAPSQESIISMLTQGLERLSKNFPWLAGQVINVNTDVTSPAVYKIRPLEAIPHLVVKDYTSDDAIPDFGQLKAENYAFSMLGENIYAPCPTLTGITFDPRKPSSNSMDPAPVMLLQATFIRGGMVLCVNMQHNTTDMTGQGVIIEFLSRACRGLEFTKEESRVGNMERKGLVPIIEEDKWNLDNDLEHQLVQPQLVPNKEEAEKAITDVPVQHRVVEPPKCVWTYFVFNSSALKELKDLATQSLPQGFHGYITTDDALSALIYQSVLRARWPRLSTSPDRLVTLARAVDARRYLSVPATYPGILQNMAYTSYPLKTLLSVALGEVAAALREQVDPKKSKIAHKTRALVTFLSKSPENQYRANFTATMKLDADIMLSSWSKIRGYDLDFGLGLGLPEAVRRPGFTPVESLIYLMPKARDGEVAAALCLREGDLKQLRQDQDFCRFATYVG